MARSPIDCNACNLDVLDLVGLFSTLSNDGTNDVKYYSTPSCKAEEISEIIPHATLAQSSSSPSRAHNKYSPKSLTLTLSPRPLQRPI